MQLSERLRQFRASYIPELVQLIALSESPSARTLQKAFLYDRAVVDEEVLGCVDNRNSASPAVALAISKLRCICAMLHASRSIQTRSQALVRKAFLQALGQSRLETDGSPGGRLLSAANVDDSFAPPVHDGTESNYRHDRRRKATSLFQLHVLTKALEDVQRTIQEYPALKDRTLLPVLEVLCKRHRELSADLRPVDLLGHLSLEGSHFPHECKHAVRRLLAPVHEHLRAEIAAGSLFDRAKWAIEHDDNDEFLAIVRCHKLELAALRSEATHDSLLHVAARLGRHDACARLVFWKSDLEAANVEHMTPLQLAVVHKHEDIALLLISKGAAFERVLLPVLSDSFTAMCRRILDASGPIPNDRYGNVAVSAIISRNAALFTAGGTSIQDVGVGYGEETLFISIANKTGQRIQLESVCGVEVRPLDVSRVLPQAYAAPTAGMFTMGPAVAVKTDIFVLVPKYCCPQDTIEGLVTVPPCSVNFPYQVGDAQAATFGV
eukprot:TRINITY_DN2607_c0_g1_i4.p1 TRINITY_DN2607_c0_g1~~TRINITY_DN2607_c0_g1_i4.p1  ORF type:complete len:494 (+),score=65.52 TRINITY_DN2607_c0_g1_i4:577-2058(+)